MRVLRLTAIFLALACLSLPRPALATVEKGQWAVGLNYPGAGVRFVATRRYAFELRGQAEKDVFVGGIRVYRYFNPETSGINLFLGAEGDGVSFKGADSKGYGYGAAAFLGGEVFLRRRISLQLDAGPAFIALIDRDTSVDVSGIDYVVNFGLNYYFGGGRGGRGHLR